MNHPILSYYKTLLIYFTAWLIVAFTHWGIIHIVTDLSFFNAVVDALVYNGLMMLMGLGIWYSVVYFGNTGKSWGIFILQYFFMGLVYVSIWLFIGDALKGLFIRSGEELLLEDRIPLIIRSIVGGLMFMVFVMVYYLFVFQQNLQEQIQNEERMNSLLRDTELKALKTQLNPHFLFNSLNSVNALTISDPDAAREMVNKLSDFLRYSLNKNEHMLISLQEEMRNISRYLEIEKVRFGDKLYCEYFISDECNDMILPVMILQPLYENAVKHGVYESIESVNIRTFCKVVNGFLEVSIINNYDDEIKSQKGESVGLKNVSDRLLIMYNRDDLIKIVKENGFYEITVLLPQDTQ